MQNVDPRTVGKILKNVRLIGLVQSPDDYLYVLAQPYPHTGTLEEKRNLVREAMLKHRPSRLVGQLRESSARLR